MMYGVFVFLNQILSSSTCGILILYFSDVWKLLEEMFSIGWSLEFSQIFRSLHLSFQILFLIDKTICWLNANASFSLFLMSLLLDVQLLGINPIASCYMLGIIELLWIFAKEPFANLRFLIISSLLRDSEICWRSSRKISVIIPLLCGHSKRCFEVSLEL